LDTAAGIGEMSERELETNGCCAPAPHAWGSEQGKISPEAAYRRRLPEPGWLPVSVTDRALVTDSSDEVCPKGRSWGGNAYQALLLL
jgi:hypothetical protein